MNAINGIPRSMTTLKGVFGSPKPKCRKNFIQENARQLREMQGYRRNKEERDSVTGRSTANRYENVPARTPYCFDSQSKNNDPNTKETFLRISGVSEKGHVRTKCSASKRNISKRKSEMPSDIPGSAAAGSERVNTVSMGCRSVGCQTVDPKNFNRLLSEGVKARESENSLLTREVGLQTDMIPSLVSTISSAAGDRLISCEKNDLDMQNLSLSDRKEAVDASQSPETDYIKMNVQSVKTRPRTLVQAVNSPLKASPTHQRGAIPKYLRERQLAWQKEAEQRKRDAPDTACPPGHILLPNSERLETLKMLKKRHAEFVQQLNMLPVSMDTLKVRNRKIELEKQLNKLEEGIKVFSRPKVFVKIDA